MWLYTSVNQPSCRLHPFLSRLIIFVEKTLKEFNKRYKVFFELMSSEKCAVFTLDVKYHHLLFTVMDKN